MTEAVPVARRVVISSVQTLVAEAIASALVMRGFELVPVEGIADAGLLLCDLADDQAITRAQETVRDNRIPWVVVSESPRSPGWGAVLTAGAAFVVDSSGTVDQIAALLESVVDGTFVPDRELEQDLRDEWAAVLSQVESRDEGAGREKTDELLAGSSDVD